MSAQHFIRLAFVSLLGLSLFSSTTAQAQGDNKLNIPFEKYILDNGLEVILHEDHSVPTVTVNVWYHVGGVNEPATRTGFAHLFEHVMFEGSAHVDNGAHFKILEEIGASAINGSTTFDRTNYYETVPSNYLETALWLESDRMGFLPHALNQDKLDGQRGVVKNERRQGTDAAPYGIADEKLWHALFPKPHPYHGDVIGSMNHLDQASLDDVRDFFSTWYAPSNATLCLAGDFDKAKAKQLINNYFASLPTKPKPARPQFDLASRSQAQTVRHDEKIAPLARVTLAWISPALFAEGDATADIIASVLTTGKASRLQKRLVHELGLAQSVIAYQMSSGHQSVFKIIATARPGVEPQKLLDEIDTVLAQVAAGEVSDKEIARALAHYEVGYWKNLQGSLGRAEILQTYNHFLGDPNKLLWDIERYRSIKADTVTTFAKESLSTEKRVVLFAVPKTTTAQADSPKEVKQ